MKKIGVVIVTYNPNINELNKFVNNIKDSVFKVIIIDNTENNDVFFDENPNVIFRKKNRNVGIALAQNEGVFLAIENRVDYLVMFDQDSWVEKSFFEHMKLAYESISSNEKVACIGPNIELITTDFKYIKKDFLISSGTFYNINIFQEVGLFNAGWFIDMIDVEWCHRARKYGYNSFIIQDVMMSHNIGENHYPRILGRDVRIGSPIRQYYLVRNWIFSLRSDSFNLRYKIKILCFLLIKIPLFSLCSPKVSRIKFILFGLLHGFKGQVGPYR
ncbi:glycosyltransferase [Pectobacterium brasiliense]|uniref:glycosyltransferase n=1 Tax=Pectobacterium brasiliense TaxID=180957 RepID=UPI0025A01C72|nr:glycosyltransferase [Pectobacterium brasiliense]WJM82150.1 glycosyltransferase [Pectobacterium brasiliense]